MNKIKTKVYIDGSNTFHAQKKLGWRIDWSKIKAFINREHEVLQWQYYVGIKDSDVLMKGFLRYLDKVGIQVFSKPLKKIKIPVLDIKSGFEEEKWIYKANFDVEITADVLLEMHDVEKIIMFSGDSDFNYLAGKVKTRGRTIEFFTSKKTVAWEIRKISGAKVNYFEDMGVYIRAK